MELLLRIFRAMSDGVIQHKLFELEKEGIVIIGRGCENEMSD